MADRHSHSRKPDRHLPRETRLDAVPSRVIARSEPLSYRADIDGLRALAVLPVVFYHAGIPGFRGGFVGVDVFFVISGYLITSLIAAGIAEGNFSLLRFYERRIRRIFPALFATIAASAIAAWFFFMPDEFEYFARSMRAAALFVSNIEFHKESGYFDMAAPMKPLLHTWSLAVEEQFYIVFPMLLLAFGRFGRRRLVALLWVLFAASFAASSWTVFRSPTDAFFLSQFRAWELLLGALLALRAVPAPGRPATRQAMAALGVGLILVAVFAFDDTTPFPGLAALLPCLGAAMVIHADAGKGVAGRMLRMPALVFVGLISYSLYLWHWPLIVFAPYVIGHEPSAAQAGVIVAASVVLAVLSWQLIEKPFRGGASPIGRKPVFAGALLCMTAAIAFGSYIVDEDGLPLRLPPLVQRAYAATYDVSRFRGSGCYSDSRGRYGPTPPDIRAGRLCALGAGGQPAPAFLVWGDSHSAAMAPAIDGAAANAGISGLFVGHDGCPPAFDQPQSSRSEDRSCRDFDAAVKDLVVARHIPLVFLVAYWPKYVHDSELPHEGVFFDASTPPPLEDKSAPLRQAMDRLMVDLARQGTKVVLVMDVPEMGHYVPEAAARAMMTGGSTDIAPPWDYVARRQALSRSMLADLAARHGARIVDPLPAFCSAGHCMAVRDGMPLYKDADHITAAAASSLAYLFEPVFTSSARDAGKTPPPPPDSGG